MVGLLEAREMLLGFPYSSAVETSKHGHMRELRIQHGEEIDKQPGSSRR